MLTLRPEHLIRWEHRLQDFLRPVLSFSTASLYFPPQTGPQNQDHVQPSDHPAVLDRDVLLIPLLHSGRQMGMLRLTGVYPEQAEALTPYLPHLLSPCLQNMELELQLTHDPLTGVLRQEVFLAQIAEHIERLAGFLQPGLGSVENPGQRPDFALLIVDITGMSALNRRAGHAFGDQILVQTGKAVQEAAGVQCQVARIQGDAFALVLPGTGPHTTHSRAGNILQAIHQLRFSHPVSGNSIQLTVSAGGVNFPQDLSGSWLQTASDELGKRLLDTAQECQKRALLLASQELFTPSEVLNIGGRITEIISSTRVRIDLGSIHQARTGHHFQVLIDPEDASGAIPRTELRLIHVEETTSLAEVLLPPGGDCSFLQANRVELIENPTGKDFSAQQEAPFPALPDIAHILIKPDEFFHYWAASRSRQLQFTLSLLDLQPHNLPKALGALQSQAQDLPAGCLLTRYGTGSLLLYIPGHSPEETTAFFRTLLAFMSKEGGQEARVGVGYFPCLDTTRGETLDLTKQSLEHARLLPPPGLACFDSTTLTLSGDRAFARNEMRQAMHAYNQALLLDEQNSLARNSLAICLAQVGEFRGACTEFRRLLELDPDNYMAQYNYGYVCLKLLEREQARACFLRCLELMPGHSYSLLRLGQMAEEDGDLEQAEAYCRQAAQAAPDQGATHRALGRLAWKAGDMDKARSSLHQTLVSNPQDPEALRLLARLTLEQGHDPEVAESLVRRSLGLQPSHPESLELLNWALRERGEE
ncbi:MAG: tetratricopeptide repeat protein [Desulfovermiculus sp.]|nr:tetratricopeptide repeat protein [Desulfovermiculus sp.]